MSNELKELLEYIASLSDGDRRNLHALAAMPAATLEELFTQAEATKDEGKIKFARTAIVLAALKAKGVL